MRSRAWGLGLFLLPLVAVGPASACSVPVFRYALERWEPVAYEALVFHRGPLPAAQQGLLRRLGPPANGKVRSIDLDGPLDADVRSVWQRQAQAALPWVVLRPPDADGQTPDVEAGPLSAEGLARLLDSPARRRLIECLGRADSGVFVLLGGTDAETEAAATMLERVRGRLERELTLPEQTPDSPPIRSPLPLRVAFSVVRLARDDPAEGPFVRMLLRGDEELARTRGPIVFPVFGRGRALGGLAGDDLNEEQIRSAGAFLIGACSCQVKELNPGVDLLLSADWNTLLGLPPESADPPGLSVSLPVAAPAESAPPPPAVPPTRGWLWGGVVAAALLTVATGAWALRSRGPRGKP
jgi:hypothetical protein